MSEFLSFFGPMDDWTDADVEILRGQLLPVNHIELGTALNVVKLGEVKRISVEDWEMGERNAGIQALAGTNNAIYDL